MTLLIVKKVVAGPRVNLVPNPSFEVGLAGWGATGITQTQSSLWSQFGSKSIRTQPTSANRDNHTAMNTTASAFGIVGGTTYTFSSYIYLPAVLSGPLDGRSRSILVYYQRASTGGSYFNFPVNPAPNAVGVTRLSVTGTFPPDVTTILIRLYNGATNSATNLVYFDAVLVEQSATLNPYFDGTTTDPSIEVVTLGWNGTPNNSTSTLTYLADDPFDLDNIDYNLAIAHGRSDVTSSPTASNAQLVLRGDTGPLLELADVIQISFDGVKRFTGAISDLDVTFLSTTIPTAITTITAMGNLAKLGYTDVGATGYIEQSARQRVTDILDATGLTYLNAGDPDITLYETLAIDAQPSTALDALARIAQGTGATYYDDPQGRIIFEDYGNRSLTTFNGTWSNQVGNWSGASGTWGSYPITIGSLPLNAEGIIFAPTWTKTLTPLINDVTVAYGPDLTQNQTDGASITQYGRREYRLETQIKLEADAITRAASIITAQANGLWNLGQVSILMSELDEDQTTQVLNLVSGSLVNVIGLPASGPYTQFNGILEGWTDSYNNGQHILTLSISDPRFSYQILEFGEVTDTLTWGDVDPGVQWYEIITNNDLIGV